jgi:heme-degrading monooxygenase HmoA
MFAHVNIWRLNEAGSSTDDTAAREIGSQLAQQEGFRSYTVVRTGEHEVVAVTVFDTEDHLRQATQALAGFVHERLAPLALGEPDRRRGDVLYHTTA